ncbi:phage tail protein [Brucella sp. MAB-22]|uniref:phage tail-collar fiber domain-containing protein n=1 Tax=Brucella sp. MAB-22 TaxID=2986424 RepID=UPI00221E6F27|nr:phage tail protein [Brucella sp. MAB-22]UYT54513.1 phage tail protein [Brucella sp. MAB-22]
MAQNTFALMTNLGRAKEAAALANGTSVVITHIAIGDGTTVPSGGETALYHEVARKAISGHGTVVGASNVAYFDIFLEASEGPFTIREAGLIDQDGDLIAIARYDPPISKPIPSSGQTVEGTIRLEVAFSNIAAITIVVDPSFKVALQRLSRLPWLPVISMSVSAPPAAPSIGDVYYVPAGATGAWNGQSGKIAEYTSAGWAILTPPEGHGISLPNGRIFEKVGGVYIEKLALDVQSGRWNFAIVGGTSSAMTGTLSVVPDQLYDGFTVIVSPNFAPNAGATFNLNGTGAKAISGADGVAVRSGDMVANVPALLIYSANLGKWILSSLSRLPTQALGFKAKHTAVTSIPSITPTTVILDQTEFDSSGMYNAANGQATIPKRGIWNVFANFFFEDVAERTNLTLRRNGVNVAEAAVNSRGRILAMSTSLLCQQGDVLSLMVVQSSSSTMNLNPSTINADYGHVFSASFGGTV